MSDIKIAWEILDRHIENLANLSLDVLTYGPAAHKDGKGTMLNDIGSPCCETVSGRSQG